MNTEKGKGKEKRKRKGKGKGKGMYGADLEDLASRNPLWTARACLVSLRV